MDSTQRFPASSPTLPRHGRVARLVPAGTAQAVLLHVIREALDPGWTPLAAARRVRDQVHGDVLALRAAHARLRAATTGAPTLSQGRALATLNIAIADLEDLEDMGDIAMSSGGRDQRADGTDRDGTTRSRRGGEAAGDG